MKPTLQSLYEEKLIKALQEELGLKNVNEVPRLEKISVNSHVGHYVNERKAAVEDAVDEISKITGQKPSVVFAKKSVANFKVREGEAVGARGRGNYAVGFSDQSIFPEIELDQIKRQIGFDFIFVTSAKTDAQAKAMLKALGMPFRDNVKEEDAA